MNIEEQSLLRKISSAQFAAWELHLFLDTHPNNSEARKKYNEYVEKTAMLVKEYEDKYGPLRASNQNMDKWKWVNDPWPWETEGN